jgi:small subunit ribosomal protein S6
MNRNYEVAFLLKEGEVARLAVERIKDYLSKVKATVVKEGDLGTRQLAYVIHRNREDFHKAFYYILHMEIDTEAISKFERQLKFDEDIIRYMILTGK